MKLTALRPLFLLALGVSLGFTFLACNEATDITPVMDQFYELPSSSDARLPFLTKTTEGNLLYSWIEEDDSLTTFLFSQFDGVSWSEAKTIARGQNWFLNWADYPSISDLGDGKLLAHYLKKSGDDTYAYDVVLVGSDDGGDQWHDAFSPHKDGTKTEHGFVSVLPLGSGQADVIWLDGRNYADEGNRNMTLRSARVGTSGLLAMAQELDERICDCCSTTMVKSQSQSLAYYRDRSESEIRDISRAVLGDVSSTMDVSSDGWEIAGCPVNGPKAAAQNETEHALAWFTAARDTSKVVLKFDLQGRLSEPIRIDDGKPLGRVDLDWLDSESVVVSWLESEADQASLNIRSVGKDGRVGEVRKIASLSSSRSTGMPQFEILGDTGYLAWTDSDKQKIVIERVRLK